MPTATVRPDPAPRTRLTALALLAVVLTVGLGARRQTDIRAGIVISNRGETSLAMTGDALAPGTRLTLITPAPPQTTRTVRVVAELPDDGDDISEQTPGRYYEIESLDGARPMPAFAVAILTTATPTRVGDTVSMRLGDDRPDIRARWCASYEGIHFTLWAGEPLKAPRIWHAYFSAGGNLRPTCEPGDSGEGHPR